MRVLYFGKKLSKKGFFAILAVALTAISAVLFVGFSSVGEKGKSSEVEISKNFIQDFLSRYSLEAEREESLRYIRLPTKDDAIFAGYAELQAKSGFEIIKYSGKSVEERYIKLRNKTESGQRLYAVVYVYKERVVAAHLTTLIDGAKNLAINAFS